MGLGTLEVTTNAVRTRVVASAPREVGKLKAFGANVISTGAEPTQVFVRLSLANGGSDPNQITAVLAQGYCGRSCTISWTGEVPMDGGNLLVLEAWGSAVVNVRATSFTE